MLNDFESIFEEIALGGIFSSDFNIGVPRVPYPSSNLTEVETITFTGIKIPSIRWNGIMKVFTKVEIDEHGESPLVIQTLYQLISRRVSGLRSIILIPECINFSTWGQKKVPAQDLLK